jgi:hypothetical protein
MGIFSEAEELTILTRGSRLGIEPLYLLTYTGWPLT